MKPLNANMQAIITVSFAVWKVTFKFDKILVRVHSFFLSEIVQQLSGAKGFTGYRHAFSKIKYI